jgi:hypothetical protein
LQIDRDSHAFLSRRRDAEINGHGHADPIDCDLPVSHRDGACGVWAANTQISLVIAASCCNHNQNAESGEHYPHARSV